MDSMDILITADEKYVVPAITMLQSLFVNNPGERFHIYFLHGGLSEEHLAAVWRFCGVFNSTFTAIPVDGGLLAGAPVTAYYSKAMYYRLLAWNFLPPSTGRALYLDPDTLVINPLRDMYFMEMDNDLFAAAPHTGFLNYTRAINRIRLNTPLAQAYYNSGVLLLNLERQVEEMTLQKITEYLKENGALLILPDQDVLNALFWDRIAPLDETIYNYNPRSRFRYFVESGGKTTMEWVLKNTAIIHYCGKTKPWESKANDAFTKLYRQYQEQADRIVYSLTVSQSSRKARNTAALMKKMAPSAPVLAKTS